MQAPAACVATLARGESGAGAGPTGADGGRGGGAPPAEAFSTAAAAGARGAAAAAGAGAAGAATAASACRPASAGAAGGCAAAGGAAGASAAAGAPPRAAAGATGSAAARPAAPSAAPPPAEPSAGGAAAAAERCVASCGMSCMSGTPALTMRAMNSSASIVSELVLIVSMKDAAEYCAARGASSGGPGRRAPPRRAQRGARPRWPRDGTLERANRAPLPQAGAASRTRVRLRNARCPRGGRRHSAGHARRGAGPTGAVNAYPIPYPTPAGRTSCVKK